MKVSFLYRSVCDIRLQGWPIFAPRWSRMLASASSGTVDLQSLAGNAFPGTVIGALFLATVFACDIACSSQADPFTDQDAVRSALELLGAVSSACVAPGQ